MKMKYLTLLNVQLDTNAAGKSWGVPMKGDILMIFDINKTNVFFMVHSIKHTVEGTRYAVTEVSKLAAYSRQTNMGYQCFTVSYVNETLGQIKFYKLES